MFKKKKGGGKKAVNTDVSLDLPGEQDKKLSALARSIKTDIDEKLSSRFSKLLVDCTVHFVDMKYVEEPTVVTWFLYMRFHLNDLLNFLQGNQFAAPSPATTGIGSIVAYHGAITALLCCLLDPTGTEFQGDNAFIFELVRICHSRESEKRAIQMGMTPFSFKTYIHSIVKPETKKFGFYTLYVRFVRALETISKLQNTFLPRSFARDDILGKTLDATEFTALREPCQALNEVLFGVFGKGLDKFEPDEEVAGAYIMTKGTAFLEWAFETMIYGEEMTGEDPNFEIDNVKKKWQELIKECFPTED